MYYSFTNHFQPHINQTYNCTNLSFVSLNNFLLLNVLCLFFFFLSIFFSYDFNCSLTCISTIRFKIQGGMFCKSKSCFRYFFPPSRQLSLRAGSVINWITFLNIVIIKKLQHQLIKVLNCYYIWKLSHQYNPIFFGGGVHYSSHNLIIVTISKFQKYF